MIVGDIDSKKTHLMLMNNDVMRKLFVHFLFLIFSYTVTNGCFDSTSFKWDRWVNEIIRSSGITGGLIVHLGCGEGQLTAALYKQDNNFLVHGLDTNAEKVESARENFHIMGLPGKVTADSFDGKNLPFGKEFTKYNYLPFGFTIEWFLP